MKELKTLSPFKRFCTTIGEIPTSYLESMTYYETLMWLCKYLEEQVKPAVNNNTLAIQELQEYVSTYFDNLDVQEEINKKLDEMSESGELENIISAYLNTKSIICFNTVSDMKQSTTIEDGSTAMTLGYHSKNDNGKAFYKIRTITNDDVIDEATIISLDKDNLIAELIYDDSCNLEVFGAYGDNTHDDSDYLIIALNKVTNIILSNKTYLFNKNIYFTENKEINLIGNNSIVNGIRLFLNTENGTDWKIAYKLKSFNITGITFINNNTDRAINNYQPLKIKKCVISGYNNFLLQANKYIDILELENIDIRYKEGNDYTFNIGSLGDEHIIKCIHISDSENIKVLKAQNKRGLVIENCINGIYEIINSNAIFKNCHFEGGEVIANVDITASAQSIPVIKFDSCHIFSSYIIPINKFIYYVNCVIHNDSSTSKKQSNYQDYMTINSKNCIIKSDEVIGNINSRGIVILDMTDNDSVLQYSGNKVIYNAYKTQQNGNWVGDKNVNYEYTIYASKQKNNLNGSNYQYSKYTYTAQIIDTTDSVNFDVESIYRNCFIHAYRKNASTNEIQRAIIPSNCAKLNDYGNNISGIKWNTVSALPGTLNGTPCNCIDDILIPTNASALNGSGYFYLDNTSNTVKYK